MVMIVQLVQWGEFIGRDGFYDSVKFDPDAMKSF